MNLRYYTLIGSLSAFVAGGALLAPMQAYAQEREVEELTRGPVHEAFAATVSYDPEPGMFVSLAPPAMIEEIPPEQRPEGDNVAWIPGYWGWDEEGNDYIWISGVWRNMPPDRQWVPGYWADAENQWQWTSGYWADEAVEEVVYRPKPPKSIETGPNVDAPSDNHVWISGTWIDQDDRYAWRPGYWEQGQEDWTWTPAHYQWTRRGYIFNDGYWDYDVDRRGVVFAPVRFQRGYYNRPGFSYTPLMVISPNVFSNHLFVRPNYCHYYFGDYYAPRYVDNGYHASFSYRSGRYGYDPIYARSRWQHRDDRGWEQGRRENFDYYRNNEDARPPRTWAAMQARPEGRRGGQRDNYQFAAPLNQYVASRPASGQRFTKISAENRNKLVEQRQQVREFSKGRQQLENRPNVQAAQGADKAQRVSREKLAKSPLMAKRAEQLKGREAPPKRPEPRASDARAGRSAASNAAAGNNPGGAKQAGQSNPAARGNGAQPGDSRGKTAGPANRPNENPAARPAQGAGPNPQRQGGIDPKTAAQLQNRSTPKADDKKADKPAADPRARSNQPAQPQKQAVQPERKPQPQPAQKAAPKPDGKAQPQAARQPQPHPAQKVAPKPDRKPEPQSARQPQAQPHPAQKLAPQQARQPESRPQPQQRAQPQPQQRAQPQPQQRAQPQPQQRAQPQPSRQGTPGQVAPGTRKKPGEEEDPATKRGR